MSTPVKYTWAAVAVLLLAWLVLRQLTALSLAEASRLQGRAPLSTGIVPDSAASHLATANRFYHEKLLKADSAARLHRFDSTLATW
jgi:hypothetical protein